MWLAILLNILPLTGANNPEPTNDLGIAIGQKWVEIDHDTQQVLRESKHWTVDKRKYFSTIEAENGDNCFVFTKDCQLDWEHYVYKVENKMSKGDYYVVEFSYNWRVIRVQDTYNHQG